jgi:PAS domain S-box-containing protein
MDKVMHGLPKIREISADQPEASGLRITEHKRLSTGTGVAYQLAKLPYRFTPVLMTFCLMIAATSAAQESRFRNVLVLNSYHPTYNWTRLVMDGIESEFSHSRVKVKLDVEYMDTQQYQSEQYFHSLYRLYKSKTEIKRYDVIIICDNSALDFFMRYHNDLYPNTPAVFCGINDFDDSMLQGCDNITGIVEKTCTDNLVEIALKLHPLAGQVVAISGGTVMWVDDWPKEGARIAEKFGKRAEFVTFTLTERNLPEVLAKIETLGDESIVLLTTAYRQRTGNLYAYEERAFVDGITSICKRCSAPIYSLGEEFGQGYVVGFAVNDGFRQGRTAAEMAIRILNGENVQNIPIVRDSPSVYTFDYLQMERFKIAVSDLPPGALILNKPQSFYYENKVLIRLAIGVFAGLVATILVLCINLIRRRYLEKALLKRAESTYRKAIENAQGVSYRLSLPDGRYVFISPWIEKLTGVPAEEMSLKRLSELTESVIVDPATGFADPAVYIRAYNEGRLDNYRADILIRTPKDELKWLSNNALPVRHRKTGRITGSIGILQDITARKQTEEALRLQKNELLFKTTLLEAQSETSIDGILVVDAEGKSVLYNRRFGQMWNIPEEILDTKDDEKMLQSVLNWLKDPEQFLERVRYLYDHRNEKSRDEIPFKDGRVYDRYSSPLVDSEGKYHGRIWYFRDITEQKKAQEALQQSEEKFRSFVETSTDVVFRLSKTGTIEYVSPRTAELYGYHSDELIGMDLQITTPAAELPKAMKTLERVLTGESIRNFEINQITKTGQLVPMEINAVPVKKNGQIIGLQGIMRDVTERKFSEQKLQKAHDELENRVQRRTADLARANKELRNEITERQRAEEALRIARDDWENIFESISDAVLILDKDHHVLDANRAVIAALKQPKEQITGRLCYELFHCSDCPPDQCPHEKLLRSEHPETSEMVIESLDGTYLVTVAPILDQQRKVIKTIHIAKDIAERKKFEQQLLTYQKQLRCLASELSLAEERLRRRIATDIHDRIGQNLAMSKIRIESLIESVSSPQLTETLTAIRDLISLMIEDTRSLTFELSPPVLYELGFKAAVEWLVRQMRQQHGLSTQFKDDGKLKPLDDNVKVLLFQAVRELLVNVAKHAHAHNVKVSSQMLGNDIQISVEDDGVGFDISEKPSYRHYNTGGFGLFSLRERLENIGGRLSIKSRTGYGTEISIVVPLNQKNQR